MFLVAHNGARIWGGAERATATLLAGLKSRGHRVLLLCNDKLVASEASKRGIPTTLRAIGGDIALADAFRLAESLRDLKPDAFLISTYKKLALAGLGAHIAGVPRVVARVGLSSDTPRNAKYRIALRRWIDAVAVNSRAMAQPFESLSGFGPQKVTVIPNGVTAPIARARPGSVRTTLRIPAQTRVIGTVCRLAGTKRIDRLIDAMAILPANVQCIIAGEGPRRIELERRCDELALRSRVHFLGHRDDIGDVIGALDVFVISSDKEGMSNAMLEAMALGVPVVSTRVSGSDDALTPVVNGATAGTIVDFSPRAIAEGAIAILNDPSRRSRMGDAARQLASREFSIEKMLDRWEAFLRPAR